MKKKILLATHGHFAEGILDSLQIITGMADRVDTFCAYVEQGVEHQLFSGQSRPYSTDAPLQ